MPISLKTGQAWYIDEQQERFIVILKIEQLVESQDICHIAVFNLHIEGPQGKILHTIGHMPFDLAQVEKGVTELKSEKHALPDFEQGYQQWKDAYDQGKAGIWSISVSEGIEALKKMINNQ